jgi:hypothetical protein
MGNQHSYGIVRDLQEPLLLLDQGTVREVHLWRTHCEECQKRGRKITLVLSSEPPIVCPYGSDHSIGKVRKINPRSIP